MADTQVEKLPICEKLRYGKDVESWWALGAEAADTIAELYEALEKCRLKFREYELLHLAKYTEEGDEKAARNREMKEMCRAAMTRAGAPQ